MNPSPSLPQHDAANAEDRKQLLYAARQQYQYDHDYLSPLAMLFVPHAWPPSLEEDVIGPCGTCPMPSVSPRNSCIHGGRPPSPRSRPTIAASM